MRPFYVIGHNTNTIANVREVLDGGANAVEPDIQWNGSDLIVAHDDGESGPLARDFLRELGDIARRNRKFCMVVLDSKIGVAIRGGRLLRYAREGLAGTNVSIILSVSDLGKSSFFLNICDQMAPNEALMVDQQDDAASMMDWLWKYGTIRACYGDDNVATSIDHAVALKVQNCWPIWVYTYTLGDPGQMRDAIRSGADGIIVHDANITELTNIVAEPEFAGKIRMATQADNPFLPPTVCQSGYTIFIQTLDRSNAGTDANVTFTLQGDGGTSLSTTIAGHRKGRFETGNLNEISLYGNIGTPTFLTVEHDGSGEKPDWLPDYAHVRRTHDSRVFATGLGHWVTSKQSLTRPLGLTRYRLKVFTGNVDHAGTDADIIFTVHGDHGRNVERRINGAPRDVFERDAIDDVYIAGIDVGQLSSVSVWNDGSGDHPGWFLTIVEVYKDNDPAVTFKFSRWVNPNMTETASRS
jgi:hypothetical protein